MTARVNADAVRAIVAQVAAERGVSADDICSSRKTLPIVSARRIALRRATDAGASSVLIAKVVGCSSSSVRGMMTRNEDKARDDLQGIPPTERARLAAPFFRSGGRLSPLTIEDYACRADIDPTRAALNLVRLMEAGLVRKELLAAKGNLPIYEWCGGTE